MTKTKEEEIDLARITRNEGTPNLISVTKERREIGRELKHRTCADPESKYHSQACLVWK